MSQRGEVHAPQAGGRDAFELAARGIRVPHRHVREADVARGLDRAEVGEPLVVDAHPHRREVPIELEARVVAQQLRKERDRLEVLASVEDHFRRDAVAIHVVQPRVHVEMTSGELVRVGGEAGRGRGPRRARRLVIRHQRVERFEVASGAVGPQLRAEQGPDVRVGRHDHDGCFGL